MNKPIRREFLRKLVHTTGQRLYTNKYMYMATCIKYYELYHIYREPILYHKKGRVITIGNKMEDLGVWEYK